VPGRAQTQTQNSVNTFDPIIVKQSRPGYSDPTRDDVESRLTRYTTHARSPRRPPPKSIIVVSSHKSLVQRNKESNKSDMQKNRIKASHTITITITITYHLSLVSVRVRCQECTQARRPCSRANTRARTRTRNWHGHGRSDPSGGTRQVFHRMALKSLLARCAVQTMERYRRRA